MAHNAGCAHGSAPVGAALHESGSSPWVRRSALTGAQLNATRFRPRVTLTFDLLNPKVERLLPLPRRSLVPTGIKIGSRCQHIMFTGLVTDERTDGRGGSTGGGSPPREVEKITSFSRPIVSEFLRVKCTKNAPF